MGKNMMVLGSYLDSNLKHLALCKTLHHSSWEHLFGNTLNLGRCTQQDMLTVCRYSNLLLDNP